MYEDRAALGAQTYTLPQVAAVPPTVQQPYDDGVKALEGLQFVKGQTEDYYKKVAALKSFMQDAHANLGVDVRVPDMSRPESIKLHQIYNDAISDILQQGNLLKNSQALLTMRDQRGVQYAEGVDPNAQAAATLTPGEQFYERPLEQQVQQANQLFDRPTYDQAAEDAAMAQYNEKINEYKRLIKENPAKRSYYEYQMRGLNKPVKHIKQYNPYQYEANRGKGEAKDNAIDVQLRKIVNLIHGNTAQWNSSTEPLPGGEEGFYKINTEYRGMKLGANGEIDKLRMNPKTGEKEWVMKDGSIRPVENDAAVVMQQLVESNPRFNVTGAEMYDYIHRKGMADSSGALIPEPLLAPKEEQDVQQKRIAEEEAGNIAKQVPIKFAIKDALKNTKSRWYWNDDKELKLPAGLGKSVTFTNNGNNNFTIKNFDELFPSSMFIDPKTKKPNSASRTRLKEALTEQPLDAIITELLKRIPVAQYPAIYEQLGIPQDQLDRFGKVGENNAGTNVEVVNKGGKKLPQ